VPPISVFAAPFCLSRSRILFRSRSATTVFVSRARSAERAPDLCLRVLWSELLLQASFSHVLSPTDRLPSFCIRFVTFCRPDLAQVFVGTNFNRSSFRSARDGSLLHPLVFVRPGSSFPACEQECAVNIFLSVRFFGRCWFPSDRSLSVEHSA
jgi:hypothetical protein